jgi:predicted RecA/RadA family phage recombinase
MAEYVPVKAPGDAITLTAGAAITAGNLVYISAANTVLKTSAATVAWVGVAANDAAASGDLVTVWTEGVHVLTASGTIAAGATVEPAASGQVASHTAGTNDLYAVGVALTASTVGNPVVVAFR